MIPFIISLLHDHPLSFGSQQFAYKRLWLDAYCLQLCTHCLLITCLQLDPGSDDHEAVKELRIANDDVSNERYIYAATESRVYRLPLQRCSRLQGCKWGQACIWYREHTVDVPSLKLIERCVSTVTYCSTNTTACSASPLLCHLTLLVIILKWTQINFTHSYPGRKSIKNNLQ